MPESKNGSPETKVFTGGDSHNPWGPVVPGKKVPGTNDDPLSRGADDIIITEGAERVQDKYLLLIAIDRYNDAKQNLRNPVRDANALLEVLMDRYGYYPDNDKNSEIQEGEKQESFKVVREVDYNGISFEYKVYNSQRIICLYNEHATCKNIYLAVNRLIYNMSPDSQLLIYFSGHGSIDMDTNNEFILTPCDYELNDPTTYLRVNGLTNKGNKEKCRNLLLIVDACYSGSATFGNKHESDLPFSREVLASCSHAQLASDGKPYEGSPFSLALVDILKSNGARASIELVTLASAINDRLKGSNEGNQQRVSHGTAPAFENGAETFCFQLEKDKSPQVELFFESFVNHLNFNSERSYFTNELDLDDDAMNKDYYLISSVAHLYKVEKLRAEIITKLFTSVLRGDKKDSFRLKRKPTNYSWDMTEVNSVEEIFRKIQVKNTGLAIDDEHHVSEFVKKTVEQLGAVDPDLNADNPVCLMFTIDNFSPAWEQLLTEFLFRLLSEIEDLKRVKSGKRFEKLLIYIISKISKDMEDEHSFSSEANDALKNLFSGKRIAPLQFQIFDKVAGLKNAEIKAWLRETGNVFDATSYKHFRENYHNRKYAWGDSLEIPRFIDNVCDEVYGKSINHKNKLLEIIFF